MTCLCVQARAHAHVCRLRYRRQSEAAAGGCRRAQQQLYAAGGFRTTVCLGIHARCSPGAWACRLQPEAAAVAAARACAQAATLRAHRSVPSRSTISRLYLPSISLYLLYISLYLPTDRCALGARGASSAVRLATHAEARARGGLGTGALDGAGALRRRRATRPATRRVVCAPRQRRQRR